METYEAPSISIPSRGQRFVLARRNCPEVIKPTAALQTAITPGVSWALGTRQNVVTAAQFGNTPLILVGVALVNYSGKNQTTNTGGIFINEEGQIRMYIDKGLGTGDEFIAEFPWFENAVLTLSGLVDDVISSQLVTFQQRRISLSHQLIAPYTLIRADAASSQATTYTVGLGVTPYFYTPANYNLIEVPLSEYENELGNDSSVDFVRKTRCFPSLGSVQVLVVGTLYEIDAALNADYLIEGWAWGSTAGGGGWFEIDFATCPQGSLPSPENIQARGSVKRLALVHRSAGHEQFFHPFIAYKGERLMATLASENGTTDPYVMLYGRRI